MDFAEIRSRIRAIIFAITGFVAAFLFLRITLDLIGADQDNILVSLINQITNPLIIPFVGLITLPQTGILELLNTDAIIAFIVYILAAIAISEIVTAFIYDNFKDIFQNIVDAIFKFIEAFLIIRIVFDLFAVGLNLDSPQFVKVVYGFTQWSQGIIFDQPFLSGKINLSAIICLIIVVIIDLLTERFLESIFTQVKTITSKTKVSLPKVNLKTILPKPQPKVEKPVPAPVPQPVQQNIIINVPVPANMPMPQQPPQVQVQNPPPNIVDVSSRSGEVKIFEGPKPSSKTLIEG